MASVIAIGVSASAAPPKVQFSKQVLPILKRECGSCHAGSAAPGGYSIESAERLLAGGRHGAAVVAGKSGASTLPKYLTGELKPIMPPGKPLSLDTIALIKRWIDEGAKIDAMVAAPDRATAGIMRDAMPMMKRPGSTRESDAQKAGIPLPSPISQAAPVTALSVSPDGKWVAAGGFRAVRLLDAASGEVRQTLNGASDQVLSVAWSSDGKRLAAAGGVPGSFGEVALWEQMPTGDWGKPKLLKEHADSIYGVAWRPGGTEFATASLDKTARVWDAASGKVLRVVKDHVDAVLAVAYSADGKWMATGSADRTAKLYLTESGQRVTSLTHGDAVTAVVFGGKSETIATACADKQVRLWPVRAGTVENPLRGQGEGEPVNAIAYSSDGSTFAWGAMNRRVRIWNGELSQHQKELRDAQDWVYSVALSPTGDRVYGGTGEGKLYIWNRQDGKLISSTTLGGSTAVAAAGAAAKAAIR